jgi:hypothetical protein
MVGTAATAIVIIVEVVLLLQLNKTALLHERLRGIDNWLSTSNRLSSFWRLTEYLITSLIGVILEELID